MKAILDIENEQHHFLDLMEKRKIAGITQNGLKSLIFIVIPKQRK